MIEECKQENPPDGEETEENNATVFERALQLPAKAYEGAKDTIQNAKKRTGEAL